MNELQRKVRLGVLEAPASHIFHFKHGWIPLDHEAAGEARKGVDTPDGGKVRLRADAQGNHIVETQKGRGSWLPNRFSSGAEGQKAAESHAKAYAKGGMAGAAKEQAGRNDAADKARHPKAKPRQASRSKPVPRDQLATPGPRLKVGDRFPVGGQVHTVSKVEHGAYNVRITHRPMSASGAPAGDEHVTTEPYPQGSHDWQQNDPVHVVTPQGHVINGKVQAPPTEDTITSKGHERSTTIPIKWDDGDQTHERPQDVQRGHRPVPAREPVKPKEISAAHLRSMGR